MHKRILLSTIVTLGLVACDREPEDLEHGSGDDDRPKLQFCDSFYWEGEFDPDDLNSVFKVWDGQCAVGAICGAGAGYFICPPAEVKEAVTKTPDFYRTFNPTYPACDGSENDGCGICLFGPGCPSAPGRCVHGALASVGFLESECREQGCLTYCGCDGETFEGLPTRPFRHPGPCAPSNN